MISRKETLIFIHIPKTAGITLRDIVDTQYDRHACYKIDGERIAESVAEFKALPAARKGKIRVMVGHMPFGLDEFLPQPSRYITFLRHPVDRIVSHYYFVLRDPTNYLHEEVAGRGMTLRDYAISGIATELDNGQTRYLSNSLDLPYWKCTREHLEIAKHNLKRCALVGLTERFDESLLMLKERLGWGRVFYMPRNVTASRIRLESLTGYDLAGIETSNALDLELYDFARTLFERQVAASYGQLRADLARFRFLNNCYQDLLALRGMIRPVKRFVQAVLRPGGLVASSIPI
jgi:hypothetical protein